MRFALVGALLLALFAAGTVAGIVVAYSRNLPNINRMADFQPARSTRIYARNGQLLATLYTQNRIVVPIGRIPNLVREAFVANEDHSFYYNDGVDFEGIARAAIADLTHRQFQGASTITQQLARGLFLNDEISISRKIEEALLAMEIERYYTKDEILDRYLNLIYLGAGAYGVDAASHTYFGKSVSKLTLGQGALLAGLVAAPSDYSPYVNLKLARERERHVLGRMVASGYITRGQAAAAFAAPLGLIGARPQGLASYRDPWFTTYVIAKIEKAFGTRELYEGGLQVYTTVDPHLERIAQRQIDWGIAAAKAEGIDAHQGALVAIAPATGQILAMVGGTNFSIDNQFNRAWQARRQPGSSFKVYVYTAAIDGGMPASTIIDDSPVSYPAGNGQTWSPHDDDDRFMGPITLLTALALSRNVVAVKLLQRVGIGRAIEYAHRMGVKSPLDADLSLVLGTSVVTPLDQASGYQTLADEGVHIDPTALTVVRDSLGNVVLDDRYPQQTEVVSAGTAYIMDTMLEDVIEHGTGYPNAIIGRPAAGKTGTTSDFRDAWFVGYTPDLVTAVWIGNDDYSPMNESYGGDIPARIWARFMKAALAKVPKHRFPFPTGEVVKAPSCRGGYEYYLDGTQPETACGRGAAPVPTGKPTASSAKGIGVPIEADPYATASSAPTPPSVTQPPSATQPPNSVGDGTHYILLGSPPPKASPQP